MMKTKAIHPSLTITETETPASDTDAYVQLPRGFIPDSTESFVEEMEVRFHRIPIPRPVPNPVPLVFGSRFLIWKQDPSVRELGIRRTFIPILVLNGPQDARITTNLPGTTPVVHNAGGDFILRPGTAEFDCAHTYAVVRQTLTMYERARGGQPIPWAWNSEGNIDSLTVFPRAGVSANAFYSRSQKALRFFFFTPSGASVPVFTCRSLDIVSHETGHAILDGLKPGWFGRGNPPQTGGLHESFGDLSAIFVALSQLDQVETVIAITKANLHNKSFLAALAEQFGRALGRPMGLRNADNDLKLSQVSNEVHDLSKVFTGGIYDVMADIFAFERRQQKRSKDPAEVLLEVGQHVRNLLLNAIIQSPNSRATYADVVNNMLTVSHGQGDPRIYRTFIRNRFVLREVMVSPIPLTSMFEGSIDFDNPDYCVGEDLLELKRCEHPSDAAPQDLSGCCGTMQLAEYTTVEQKQLKSGKCIAEEYLLREERKELMAAFKKDGREER